MLEGNFKVEQITNDFFKLFIYSNLRTHQVHSFDLFWEECSYSMDKIYT